MRDWVDRVEFVKLLFHHMFDPLLGSCWVPAFLFSASTMVGCLAWRSFACYTKKNWFDSSALFNRFRESCHHQPFSENKKCWEKGLTFCDNNISSEEDLTRIIGVGVEEIKRVIVMRAQPSKYLVHIIKTNALDLPTTSSPLSYVFKLSWNGWNGTRATLQRKRHTVCCKYNYVYRTSHRSSHTIQLYGE